MAFMATRSIPDDGEREMTVEQFKRWLKSFDIDTDGRISKEELADAVRVKKGWFARWKGKRGIKSADSNGNGFVDENEINNLIGFAQKHLGIKIISP
ncbi:hypothetical protein JCGZ_04290 [Jatropha curcas]|uniref:EF-hand domain-containing protein n=1 Tax=Jatropha curcas TaxID=180498 RepID=A0A067L1K3_JATCU|nr:hypothetical protein JCGZ_04290 [Jatropha curcas]